jgi:tRNA splicing ligase
MKNGADDTANHVQMRSRVRKHKLAVCICEICGERIVVVLATSVTIEHQIKVGTDCQTKTLKITLYKSPAGVKALHAPEIECI